MDKYTNELMHFASIDGKRVEAAFDAGLLTSDGGVLHLREVDRRVGVIDRIVGALRDRRDPRRVEHPHRDLARQRVYQIACGYEDAEDCDSLRKDPAMKMACERTPAVPPITKYLTRWHPKDLYRAKCRSIPLLARIEL